MIPTTHLPNERREVPQAGGVAALAQAHQDVAVVDEHEMDVADAAVPGDGDRGHVVTALVRG
ncbi:hypothetical protein GCM10022245_65560 [Streptomyces mayteni]